MLRGRRIRQRAKHVEHARDAERGAHRSHESHRRVEGFGEGEGDAHLIGHLGHGLRFEIERQPERLQTVGRPALGARGAVAVLGDLHAARGRNQRGRGGYVEAVRVVAAGADYLEYVHAGIDARSVVAHCGGTARDLVGGLGARAFCGQRREEGGVLRGCGFAAHYFVHHGICFVIGEVFLAYYLYDCFLNHGLYLLNKIFKHSLAVRGHYGFGMELNAVYRVVLMLNRHHFAVGRECGYF